MILFGRLFKVLDAFADSTTDFRETARPEDYDDDRENDQKLRDADAHVSP